MLLAGPATKAPKQPKTLANSTKRRYGSRVGNYATFPSKSLFSLRAVWMPDHQRRNQDGKAFGLGALRHETRFQERELRS